MDGGRNEFGIKDGSKASREKWEKVEMRAHRGSLPLVGKPLIFLRQEIEEERFICHHFICDHYRRQPWLHTVHFWAILTEIKYHSA